MNLARQRWGDRLCSAYALGSLAHGGFSAASDVDLGIVLADPLLAADAAGVAELAGSIKNLKKPFAERLSVFWGSPASLSGASSGGRFPPLDRLDLIKYGRLLAGQDLRDRFATPSTQELVIASAEFALRRLGNEEVIAMVRNPAALARTDRKSLIKYVLYPVRLLFTARTGDVGRNDAAVEHFASGKARQSSALARRALEWRNAERLDPAETTRVIAEGVLPLYEEFLSEYARRLKEYDRSDLAQVFLQWRDKLKA